MAASKKTIRREAARKLMQIFIRDKGRCQICREKVFPSRLLVHKNITYFDKCEFTNFFIINNKFFRRKTATIDHIIPLSKDATLGSNRDDNLRLCCRQCNHDLDQRHRLFNKYPLYERSPQWKIITRIV